MPFARKMWRTLEPYHSMVYFSPELFDAYRELGIDDYFEVYFGSRAAAMGAVSPEVVLATFFNFSPAAVHLGLPAVWSKATPEQLIATRLKAADTALRRMVGDDVESDAMAEAATLARIAADHCTPEGRPIYAAHAALPYPGVAHLDLWHAITLLREYRGDGHVVALTAHGLSGCGALVLNAASGGVDADAMRYSRLWTEDEWNAATDVLRDRGWVDAAGAITPAGTAVHDELEALTDELAAPAWSAITDEQGSRLRELVRPWSRALTEGGLFPAGFARR